MSPTVAACKSDSTVLVEAVGEAAGAAALDGGDAAVEAVGVTGGVATAGVAAAVAAAATCVSFLGTLVAGLAPGVSAGDVLGLPLAPRGTAVPAEFWTRALVDATRELA